MHRWPLFAVAVTWEAVAEVAVVAQVEKSNAFHVAVVAVAGNAIRESGVTNAKHAVAE